MKWRRALAAGVVAGAATALLSVAVVWLLRHDANLRATMDRGVYPTIPWLLWIPILVGMTLGGTLIAIAYALVFELVTRRAGALVGGGMGIVHAAIVWLGVGLTAWFFPVAANVFGQELSIVSDSLWAITAFAVAHVMYGALVGMAYGSPRRSANVQLRILWRELTSRGDH